MSVPSPPLFPSLRFPSLARRPLFPSLTSLPRSASSSDITCIPASLSLSLSWLPVSCFSSVKEGVKAHDAAARLVRQSREKAGAGKERRERGIDGRREGDKEEKKRVKEKVNSLRLRGRRSHGRRVMLSDCSSAHAADTSTHTCTHAHCSCGCCSAAK